MLRSQILWWQSKELYLVLLGIEDVLLKKPLMNGISWLLVKLFANIASCIKLRVHFFLVSIPNGAINACICECT